MKNAANAWLLETGLATPMAIGQRELLQIIDAPQTFAVPLSPPHARHVLFWQQHMVPVLDLAQRMGHQVEQRAEAAVQNLLALVGFQDSSNGIFHLGAIVLNKPPRKIAVCDEQALAPDDLPSNWRRMSLACFEHEGMAIPVLHLGRVFSAN